MKNLVIIFGLLIVQINLSAFQFIIDGYVLDEQSQPIANHPVVSHSMHAQGRNQTETNANGYFQMYYEINNGQTIDMHLRTWSFCDGEYISEKIMVNPYGGNLSHNFQICRPDGGTPDCYASFFTHYYSGWLNYKFYNTSFGDSLFTYHWNFGDGSTSNEKSPTHHFNPNNIYLITLEIDNYLGCSDKKEILFITDEPETMPLIIELNQNYLPKGEVFLFQPNYISGSYWMYTQKIDNDSSLIPMVPLWDSYLYVIPDWEDYPNVYPIYLPTYSGGSKHWQTSSPVNLMDIYTEIELASYDLPFYGNGKISGSIRREDKKILKAAIDPDYITEGPGIFTGYAYDLDSAYRPCVVFLEDSGHNHMDFRYLKADGSFEFDQIPLGEYQIRTEIFNRSYIHIDVILDEENEESDPIDIVITPSSIYLDNPDVNKQPNFSIFPNPTSDYINIESHSIYPIESISVFDVQGKILLSERDITGSTTQINLHQLPKSIYSLVIIMNNGEMITKRIEKL